MKRTLIDRWLNQRFGRLFIVNVWVDRRITFAICECDCGARIQCRAGDLKSGNTSSCGCFRRDNTRAMKTTHGYTNSDTYPVWTEIKRRCYNKASASYTRYGARGISMSDEWRASFETFSADMGPRPSRAHQIDRIDNDGNYCKENCRWVTRSENMRNTSRAIFGLLDGKELNLRELSAATGVKYGTLYYRHRRGLKLA